MKPTLYFSDTGKVPLQKHWQDPGYAYAEEVTIEKEFPVHQLILHSLVLR